MRVLAILACAILPLPGSAFAGTLDSFIDSSRLHLSSQKGVPETCLEVPRISTDIRIQNPELTREKPRGLTSHHSSTGVLQGLAHMAYGFEIGFTLERIRSDQGICVRIAEMNVRAGLKRPEIWLRPGLQKGTCQYDVTVDHELEHVLNYHDHLRRLEQSVQRELPILLRGKAYYRVESMAEAAVAEERLKAEAMKIVSGLHDRSYAAAEALDRAMDSPAEYRRLSNICR